MIYRLQYAKLITACLAVAASLLLTACTSSSKTAPAPEQVVVYRDSATEVPGAVQYIWEEPMVNVVDVPPGLDPEGQYYRPAHQEVLEIRQGRWKYYKRPEKN